MAAVLRIVIVPGWQNSGPAHWQTLWQHDGGFERVQQENWDFPTPHRWVTALAQHVLAHPDPVLIVAHSLGCITTVQLPASAHAQIVGALLVAPADVERFDAPPQVANFAPIPLRPLPFPTHLVASDNDPYCSLSRATTFATAWTAQLHVLHQAGHINADSGVGQWPRGWKILQNLRATCIEAARHY